jgi:putative phage-type endonuclease
MALTEEQRALRRQGVTASEVAVLAGLSRWSTPIAVYEEKLGALPPDEDSLASELGTMLEEPIARLHARRTGLHLVTVGTLRSDTHPLALATPDRAAFVGVPPVAHVEDPMFLAGASHLVEIKSTSWRMAKDWGEPGTDAVPEEYLCQAVWQMGVTHAPRVEVVALFDKDRLETYVVGWNEELWLGLLEIAQRFWRDCVVAKRPPPPDASERYREYLDRAWPRATGNIVAAPPASDVEAIAYTWAKARELRDKLAYLCAQQQNALKAAIGANLGVTGRFGTVKWHRSPGKSSRLDADALATELEATCGLVLERLRQQGADVGGLVDQLRTARERHTKPPRPYSQVRATWADAIETQLKAINIPLEQLEAVNPDEEE